MNLFWGAQKSEELVGHWLIHHSTAGMGSLGLQPIQMEQLNSGKHEEEGGHCLQGMGPTPE